MMGNHDEARVRVDRSLELALNNSLPIQAATAYRFLADLRDFKADYDGARDAHLRAISFCKQKGTVSEEHMCLGCLGYALFRSGQWRQAIENARKVLLDKDAHPIARAAVAVVPAMIGVLRGERRQAVPGVVSAAGFYVDRRHSANLAGCSEILSVIAQENQNEETRAATRAMLAETACYHGDLPSAVDLMREAVERYDRVGTALEMAFLRRRFALMLAAAGQSREAEAKRREASELARRLGLRPFLDFLARDTHAAASSLSENAFPPGHAAGLTPRQHSILKLIAKGLTNKEIASYLNLSARTVEMHVALALERLNCRTRSEAISRAMSLGLLELKG